MLTIILKDLHFRSFHGLFPEEKVLGGDFVVNLTVEYQPGNVVVTEIGQTLDYQQLFQLVKAKMEISTPLLETIVMEIAGEILNKYVQVDRVWVQIEKKNPPISGLSGSVAVSYNAGRFF